MPQLLLLVSTLPTLPVIIINSDNLILNEITIAVLEINIANTTSNNHQLNQSNCQHFLWTLNVMLPVLDQTTRLSTLLWIWLPMRIKNRLKVLNFFDKPQMWFFQCSAVIITIGCDGHVCWLTDKETNRQMDRKTDEKWTERQPNNEILCSQSTTPASYNCLRRHLDLRQWQLQQVQQHICFFLSFVLTIWVPLASCYSCRNYTLSRGRYSF